MGSNKETEMDPGQVLVLLPLLSIVSGIPTFLKSSYLRCDDTACWYKTFDIEYSHVLQVPNSSLIISDWDWDWYEVTMESIIQSCCPSLSHHQMPHAKFTLCDDIDNKLQDSCQYAQKGWIRSNGDIAASFIEETFNNLENANTYIKECLNLETEGKHDFFHYYMTGAGYNYDYDYDHDFYDYDYDYGLEESNEEIVREKRDLAGIEHNLKKKKLSGEKKRRRLERKISGNKKKDRFGRKTDKRRRNRNGHKKKKISMKNKRRNKKKTINKPKKRTNRQRKKDGKNKEKLLKKTLRKIGLKSAPTKSVLNKLECIEYAVDTALEKCAQKILDAADLPEH